LNTTPNLSSQPISISIGPSPSFTPTYFFDPSHLIVHSPTNIHLTAHILIPLMYAFLSILLMV
jgi:hypothetical protein